MSDSIKAAAGETRRIITDLKNHSGWQGWFIPEVTKMRDEYARKVLEDDSLTPEERERLRAAHKALNEVITMPEKKLTWAESVLRNQK